MRARTFLLASLVACFFAVVSGFAQEGHPLKGTWSGDWGSSADNRTHLTFVMNWDGKNVTGIVNPGPNSFPIKSVVLDVTNWTVRIEADTKDPSGASVAITAQGKLEDLESYHRTLTGTWRQGATQGDFKLTRD